MLVAAAFVPQPPLLVPEVAAGAAGELDGLRGACDRAVSVMVAGRPDLVVVVGGADEPGEYGPGAVGSLRPYGVALDVPLGGPRPGVRPAALPPALTVGAWLLARSGWSGPRGAVAVPSDAAAADLLALGVELGEREPRVGLLVTGDASARMSEAAPGALDTGAEPYGARVAAALADGDVTALAGLDPDEAARLMAAGRAAWQVAAGAADAALAGGAALAATLLDREAPYGVDYLVATWTLT